MKLSKPAVLLFEINCRRTWNEIFRIRKVVFHFDLINIISLLKKMYGRIGNDYGFFHATSTWSRCTFSACTWICAVIMNKSAYLFDITHREIYDSNVDLVLIGHAFQDMFIFHRDRKIGFRISVLRWVCELQKIVMVWTVRKLSDTEMIENDSHCISHFFFAKEYCFFFCEHRIEQCSQSGLRPKPERHKFVFGSGDFWTKKI